MKRRDFLGSLIGLAAGTNFFARLISEPPQRIILPYRMTFVDTLSGYEVQAPGVQKIIEIKDGFDFVAETFEPNIAMSLNAVKLYTEKNELIHVQKFGGPVNLCYGDMLNVTDTLHLNGAKAQTPEELVQYFLKHNRGELNGIRV